ncbi:ABC transporter sub-family G-like protein 5 [Leptotrombidium deliense]|uniref:ABC transporter sub-family G-like protein 5 n=1 Tax=Leptotrombidium deliense TaxID=299467 RepID=A0A443SSV1_9ACAR|nr:ABC transporter sub-family G-like protein 5 [Leptotrombidium deliense]
MTFRKSYSPHRAEVRVNMRKSTKPAIVWRDITISHPFGDLILDEISGYANFGTMTAIMGPSGAGKTSFLRCLFGTSDLFFEGEIFVSDVDTKTVFITQNVDEHLFMNLTVEESLFYSLKLKTTVNANGKRVTDLISHLGLISCRYNLVKNCSGGQKKRLAIGQELTADKMPGIILIDEPTSGLDSRASMILIKYLQQLSTKFEIAVLATVHQPSYLLLRRFEKAYVLSKYANCLFFDEPAHLKTIVNSLQLNTTLSFNPADICMEAATIDVNSSSAMNGSSTYIEDNNTHVPLLKFAKDLKRNTENNLNDFFRNGVNLNSMYQVNKLCRNDKILSLKDSYYLFSREFINNVIRRNDFRVRLLMYILIGVLMLFAFGRNGAKSDGCVLQINQNSLFEQMTCLASRAEHNVYDACWLNVAYIFFVFMFIGLEASISASFFLDNLKVFFSEHRNGCYYFSNQPGLTSIYDLIPINYISRFNVYAVIMVLFQEMQS